jgi:predicted CopG family antitoxin
MVTTIQISEITLEMLRKLKQELNASSYDEAIMEITIQRTKKSLAGSLKAYMKKGETLKDILKGLRDKHDRF